MQAITEKGPVMTEAGSVLRSLGSGGKLPIGKRRHKLQRLEGWPHPGRWERQATHCSAGSWGPEETLKHLKLEQGVLGFLFHDFLFVSKEISKAFCVLLYLTSSVFLGVLQSISLWALERDPDICSLFPQIQLNLIQTLFFFPVTKTKVQLN